MINLGKPFGVLFEGDENRVAGLGVCGRRNFLGLGIEVERELAFNAPYTREGGRDAGLRLLCAKAEQRRPTAVVTANNFLAFGLIDAAREYILPKVVMETSGGDPSTGEFKAAQGAGYGVSFTPLLPPRMPSKDEQ